MKNLTTNILSQKILENALKGVERLINDKKKAKSGKLDENDIWDWAERIEKESSSAIDNMSRIFDALRAKGLDLSQNGSSSIGNSIKSVTEETANILASYLNAIRLDVSVDRVNILSAIVCPLKKRLLPSCCHLPSVLILISHSELCVTSNKTRNLL